MKQLKKRATALEQVQAPQGRTAAQEYENFKLCNIPAPEPIDGESGRDYIKRVPTESLEALLVACGVIEICDSRSV